jgi:spoIIIJ-associated protein
VEAGEANGSGAPTIGALESDGQSARLEAEGASAGEAKWAAMKELELAYPGLDVEHVSFELVSEGPGGNPTKVLATADLAAWQTAEREFDWPSEPAERVREVLRRVTAHLGLRASVDVEEDEESLTAAVNGDDLGLLIGKRGQTIDALQFLCSQAAYRGQRERKRVVVDAGGYRERREASLRRQADRGVADALRYGRPVELDAMTAQERRAVHVYLRDRGDVETHSEGDDPFRRIVITPVRLTGGQG